MATGHPLLDRLLRRTGVTPTTPPPTEAWPGLVDAIAQALITADQDRCMLERSIDICSQEMQGLYQELKQRSESELAIERNRVAKSLAVLRATLESTHEGILVVDHDRRIIAVNDHFRSYFHVPLDLELGDDHHGFLRRVIQAFADPVATLAEIEEIHASDRTVDDELAMPDGSILHRYSTPVRLPDGRCVGRVTFFRDITTERAAQAAMEKARIAAEAASQAKSMFLANMSHELRTPLNAVIGLADLLLLEGGDPVTGRQRQYLEGIVDSGRHLLAMVNDVLDLARIEAGKQDLDLTAVTTHEAVTSVASVLSPLATGRGVNVFSTVPVDVKVIADPLRLRQILLNLVGNAIKFTEREGSVHVSAACEVGHVAIRVADTGIGIAREDLPKLFREFEQLALPSGDRPPGTGLGLALTKRLVSMHGGTIDVASELGVGTTFTVRLRAA